MGKNKPNVGFVFNVMALLFAVGAMGAFLYTYQVFGYNVNRWVVMLTALSIWLLLFTSVNTFIAGNEPYWTSFAFVFACAFLLLAGLFFIKPCLSPIGIYFTVHDMGDVETNAVGVPASVLTAALYVGGFLCSLLCSFTGTASERNSSAWEEM